MLHFTDTCQVTIAANFQTLKKEIRRDVGPSMKLVFIHFQLGGWSSGYSVDDDDLKFSQKVPLGIH